MSPATHPAIQPLESDMPRWVRTVGLIVLAHVVCADHASAVGDPNEAALRSLKTHCFACHADGADEGGLDFDRLLSGGYEGESITKWEAVWKNVRAETMPPPEEPVVPPHERKTLMASIETDVFQLDPDNPDPGVVTARRLNRTEYRNSIREIFGVDFKTDEEFPADDTGHGFDTVADALNLSSVLFEKYLAAADTITSKAIPVSGPSPYEFEFWGDHWKGTSNGVKLPFNQSNRVQVTKPIKKAGRYRVHVDFDVDNGWRRRSETATAILRNKTGDVTSELDRQEAGWMFRNQTDLVAELDLAEGDVSLELEIVPGEMPGDDKTKEQYSLRIAKTRIIGPLSGPFKYHWPASTIIFDGPPPEAPEARRDYAREIIRRRADLAFRRPIDDATLNRLTDVAATEMSRPGRRFEHGIKAALSLVIVSPRFIFRTEGQPEPDNPALVAPLDDFDLATRISYFLTAGPPDTTLHQRARDGKVRSHIDEVIDRLLADNNRRRRFIESFVGQWLQLRDIHSINSNIRVILGDKHPQRREVERRQWNIREAMRRETEALFDHVLVQGLPIEELLTARYTFVNKYSALAYGLKGVKSDKFERIELDPSTNRRGLLTHGSVLLVTSNPTRTSPVKRGLFILENVLGTPAPPAPAGVPALEETKSIDLKTASLRDILEAHRKSPECASCHRRMDPLGLALEHYDAFGMYRDVERARPAYGKYPATPEKPIDPSGQLLSGESFQTLDELIDILAETRRRDLYRCLTEKLMTYGLGRGIEYTDATTVESIVNAVEADGGSLKTLIREIIKSRPFQYRRGAGKPVAAKVAKKN